MNRVGKDFMNPKRGTRPNNYGWIAGEYYQKCPRCGDTYIGSKHSMVCEDCAYTPQPIKDTKILANSYSKGHVDKQDDRDGSDSHSLRIDQMPKHDNGIPNMTDLNSIIDMPKHDIPCGGIIPSAGEAAAARVAKSSQKSIKDLTDRLDRLEQEISNLTELSRVP